MHCHKTENCSTNDFTGAPHPFSLSKPMLVRGNCSICFDVTARAPLQVGHRPFWYQALVCFQRRPDKGLISSWTVPFSPIHHRTARQGVEEVQQGCSKLSYLLDSKEVQGFSASAPRRAIRDIGFAGNSLNPTIGGCQRVHGIKLTDHIPAWLGWDSTLLWSRNGRHHYPPTRLNGGVSKATEIASVSKPSHTAQSDKLSGHRPELFHLASKVAGTAP